MKTGFSFGTPNNSNVLLFFLLLLFSPVTFSNLSDPAAPLPPATWESHQETIIDLSVKVLGGRVTANRLYFNKQWHYNREWNPIVFLPYGADRMILKRNDLDFVSQPLSRLLDTTLPDGSAVEFILNRRLADGYPFSSRMRFIVRGTKNGSSISPTSYRWEDGNGNWIEYESFSLPNQTSSFSGRVTSYGDRNNVQVSLQYDVEGKRTGAFDHLGAQVLWFEYYPSGKLKLVKDSTNRQVVYAEDGSSVTDVRGNVWSYTYTTSSSPYDDYLGDLKLLQTLVSPYAVDVGLMSTRTDAEGRIYTYSYTSSGALSTALDESGAGARRDYEYDNNAEIFTVIEKNGEGRVTEYRYNKFNQLLSVTINGERLISINYDGQVKVSADRNGNKTTEKYDQFGNLQQVIYPDNAYIKYVREPKYNNVTEYTNENGVVFKYEYNGNGNLIRQVQAVGLPEERVREYAYDIYGNRASIKFVADANTAEAIWAYEYNNKGNVSKVTDPENGVATYTYDVMGNALTLTDARNKVWTSTFDSAGNKLTDTNPLNHVTSYVHDKIGNTIQMTNADNKIVTYTYNSQNRLSTVTNPENGTIKLEYNKAGNLTKITDPDQVAIVFGYDNSTRLTTIKDGNGNVITTSYSAEGGAGVGAFFQAAQFQYPTYSRQRAYDNRRRVIAENMSYDLENLVTQYTYDNVGNILAIKDTNDQVILYDYDAFGNVIKYTDILNHSTSYEYDDRNNMLTLTDANTQTTQWSYDRNNRAVSETRPLGQSYAYSYDGNGNLTQRIDPKGQKLTYIYDDAGRLSTVDEYTQETDTTPSKTTSYGYDNVGNISSWNDGTYSATYTYNGLNRQLSQSVNYGTFTLTSSYSYFPSGRKKSYTGPDGVTVTYTYGLSGELSGVQIPAQGSITINSRKWLAPEKVSYPGGSTRETTYNGMLNPLSITVKDPALNTNVNLDFAYNNVQTIKSKKVDQATTTYDYDALYRLAQADYGDNIVEDFGYDPLGNRTTYSGESWSYNANNQITARPNITYSYDDNGNLTQKADTGISTNYQYDLKDRLIRVADQVDTTIATYQYDPLGRRISKSVAGVMTYFFYTREGLVAEVNSTGAVQTSYGFSPDGLWGTNPLYQKQNGEYYYYHNDHLGTPIKLTAQNGIIAWAATYEAFGQASVDASSTITNNLRFPGQYYDEETGAHYNYFRYYDSKLGRYMTSDPIGFRGGLNLYGYAFQSPVHFFDELGLKVYVYARYLAGGGGFAGAHTYVVVIDSNGTVHTYSSFKDNGQNLIIEDHPYDSGPTQLPLTTLVEIDPPNPNITPDQWDAMVIASAERQMDGPPRPYEPFPPSTPVNGPGGNCHSTTKDIIEGAGGSIPNDFNPPGINTGLH